MNQRYSLTEANQVLKLVRVIAAEMLERRNDRRHLARERERLESAETPEGLRTELAELDARIWEHDEALLNCRHELEDLGLTVLRTNPLTIHIPGKSLASGQTAPRHDHGHAHERPGLSNPGPSNTRGSKRDVVFCWQEGEDAVCFGHPVGEEEHQRRPLRVAKGA
ncbi:MAG: hypothetical protein AB8H80_01130 [Planctomycetota bacterium]